MTTAADIARGLTKAMKVALLSLAPAPYGNFKVVICGLGTMRALENRGCLDGALFTPLGLEVRAILQAEEDGQCRP